MAIISWKNISLHAQAAAMLTVCVGTKAAVQFPYVRIVNNRPLQ
jgi:hypothetical protein